MKLYFQAISYLIALHCFALSAMAQKPDIISVNNPVPFSKESLPLSELNIVEAIRNHIIDTAEKKQAPARTNYSATVPKTGAKYTMLAVSGGEVLMGSPDDEKGRLADEGPQYKAKVDPFWMGKYEVTWDEFKPFLITRTARKRDGYILKQKYADDFMDLISSPTSPYTEMSFGMGLEGFPAICMTHHAASKYCQWLSSQTGHFYRLPTEAEWEYACRAGTTSAYWCGEDEETANRLEIMDPEEKRFGYEKIGSTKPNPLGLYDMHGNVMEWCLDGYVEDRKEVLMKQDPDTNVFVNPYIPATTRYPRVARGGSWYDYPELCRSASRAASSSDWIVQDPQKPQSLWHLSDAHWLGFRLVRSPQIPSAEEMMQIWNSGNVHHEEKKKK